MADVTDTFVDPAGNIVVATCTGKEDGGTLRGDLEVFTTGGAYAMPLKGIEVSSSLVTSLAFFVLFVKVVEVSFLFKCYWS